MNRRIYIILILISSCSALLGQSLGHHVASFDSKVQQKIELEGYGSYGSSVMDINTMRLFYRGGYFDNELKAQSVNRLGGKNLFGGEYSFRVGYENPYVRWLDSACFYLNYEINGAGGIAFTEDLFRLVFEGNQGYEGDSAFLSGIEMSSFAFKKLGLGYIRSNKNGMHKVGLSLMSFDSYSYGVLDRGIYTADVDSDTLQLILSGNWMTDTRADQGSPIGYGIGVDYEAKLFPLQSDSTSAPMLICGVKNLGLFFSTNQMNTMSLDTIYTYSSVEVNDFSDFANDLFPQSIETDSILPEMEQNRKFRALPFELYFYSPSDPNGRKFQLIYGMRYRYGVTMIPQMYLGGDWRPNESTIISSYLSFGGYSFFKTGLAIRKEIGKVRVGVVLNNVPGFLTDEAYEQSLAISLSYGIK